MFRRIVDGSVLGCVLAIAASLDAHASAGHFEVTIATAPTHNMTLSNGVYSPSGDNAVLNVNDLTNALSAANLEVTTGNGAAGKAYGDIVVETALHWVSGNTLTLDAYRSIRVDQQVTDAGAGALALTTDDGGTNGHLEFAKGGSIGFWGIGNALTINRVSYTLVNNVASLASAITAYPGGNYALAASYDASVDGTYRQSAIPAVFDGKLEGLGNAISNVSVRIDQATETNHGFFNVIDVHASVSNLRLLAIQVAETLHNPEFLNLGGLAGTSNGTLYGDEVSGTIIGAMAPFDEGGLIGSGSGSITRCSSTAILETRKFDGYEDGAVAIGGLAGEFGGTIADSFSTSDVPVKGPTLVAGGLIGDSGGAIRHSHATGNLKGKLDMSGDVGGLVGASAGPISDSYATGNIMGQAIKSGYVGGLVGEAFAPISGSFATGGVDAIDGADEAAGGLVGIANAAVSDSYATGAAGGSAAGGLVGVPEFDYTPTISNSYSTGRPGGFVAGGFSGGDCNCFVDDYWDTTTSGTTDGVFGQNAPGVTGYTTQQLQAGLPPGFDPKIWAEDARINKGLPYLKANPPPD